MPRSLFALVALALPLVAARGDDWPQWFGPKRDAVWREDGLLDKFPEGGPKVRWRQPIGPGYASPAIVGDHLYVMDRETDKPSLKDAFAKEAMPGKERVLCLDVKTGKEIWHYSYDCPYVKLSYPSGPRTTPVVENGKVYTLGAMGHLFCLDAEKGKVIWQKELNKVYKSDHPIWGHAASLLIDGKKLITLAGGQGSAVVALDKENGNQIWKALASEEVCYCPPTIIEAGGKRQLIIWLSETLNSLNPETGESYWMLPYPEDGMPQRPGVNIPQPRVVGDVLFVSSFYHGPLAAKLAKESPTAEVLYRGKKMANPEKATTLHALMSTPGEKDGYLYGSGAMGEIQCIEPKTGKRLWTDKKPFGKDALFGTIFFIRQGERFCLFTDQGDLIIANLSPKGYEEICRANVIKPSQTARGRDVVWCHPAFAGKCLYVRNDKEIVCVELGKS
jgi:outer membrane protein assembly factor BamB